MQRHQGKGTASVFNTFVLPFSPWPVVCIAAPQGRPAGPCTPSRPAGVRKRGSTSRGPGSSAGEARSRQWPGGIGGKGQGRVAASRVCSMAAGACWPRSATSGARCGQCAGPRYLWSCQAEAQVGAVAWWSKRCWKQQAPQPCCIYFVAITRKFQYFGESWDAIWPRLPWQGPLLLEGRRASRAG